MEVAGMGYTTSLQLCCLTTLQNLNAQLYIFTAVIQFKNDKKWFIYSKYLPDMLCSNSYVNTD